MAKKILSNVLEEDRRSTGLIQRGILFWILDQIKLPAI
jgi:hypothetical protein